MNDETNVIPKTGMNRMPSVPTPTTPVPTPAEVAARSERVARANQIADLADRCAVSYARRLGSDSNSIQQDVSILFALADAMVREREKLVKAAAELKNEE